MVGNFLPVTVYVHQITSNMFILWKEILMFYNALADTILNLTNRCAK